MDDDNNDNNRRENGEYDNTKKSRSVSTSSFANVRRRGSRQRNASMRVGTMGGFFQHSTEDIETAFVEPDVFQRREEKALHKKAIRELNPGFFGLDGGDVDDDDEDGVNLDDIDMDADSFHHGNGSKNNDDPLQDEMLPLLSNNTRRKSSSRHHSQRLSSNNKRDYNTDGLLGFDGMEEDVESQISFVDSHFEDDDEISTSSCKRITTAILYGLINSIVLIPVIISFAQIIFRNPYFESAMPYLIKLVILSSSVHQTIFTIVSSLPFAIGQVQDAGLIFLSSMASSIVHYCEENGSSRDETFATVLVWLALSTALLGVALIITGKLKLASLVQYLPMPVVGGYLAYIGFYCLQAGLSLMSGVEILSVMDLPHLFHRNELILIAPGIALGLGLVFVTTKFKHFAVLPACLIIIPIGFHIILLATNTSLQEAREVYDHGWLAQTSNSSQFWLVFEHFEFKKVQWGAVPRQIPTWLAMYFVVAFSSSLDVAAIQMELGKALDFNHELLTVGISNLVSGITGGYTGSYIFSQTIFTMRSKANSRVVGIVVIVLSVAMFMVPFSILAYIPKLFFGSILTFIALELMWGWLLQSFRLVHFYEFVVIWFTFLVICFTNLEIGMASGVGLAIFIFILKYSQTNATRRVKKQGNVVRPFTCRRIINEKQRQFVILEISGFIFFGSSVGILNDVKKFISEIDDMMKKDKLNKQKDDKRNEKMNEATISSSIQVREQDQEVHGERIMDADNISSKATKMKGVIPRKQQLGALNKKFIILDFKDVTGIDASAIRTCFIGLKQVVLENGSMLCLCGLHKTHISLLRAHGVIAHESDHLSKLASTIRLFRFVDDALVFCEDTLLGELALSYRPAMSLNHALKAYMIEDEEDIGQYDDILRRVKTFFVSMNVNPSSVLFKEGDVADGMYFLEAGEIALVQEQVIKVQHSSVFKAFKNLWSQRSKKIVSPKLTAYSSIVEAMNTEERENIIIKNGEEYEVKEKLFKCRPGSIFGDLDIVLNNPSRSYTAKASTSCTVQFLSRQVYHRLRLQEPEVFGIISQVLTQTLASSIKNHVDGVFV
eukprot:m.61143 g.61143  ORF g.61143 m.61143 type:complete len:1064 (-) comp7982_c0_seq1:318-3509(-)